jgi:hypothetical protein
VRRGERLFVDGYPDMNVGAIIGRRPVNGPVQIAATDREIDGIVYELYGLTEEAPSPWPSPEGRGDFCWWRGRRERSGKVASGSGKTNANPIEWLKEHLDASNA